MRKMRGIVVVREAVAVHGRVASVVVTRIRREPARHNQACRAVMWLRPVMVVPVTIPSHGVNRIHWYHVSLLHDHYLLSVSELITTKATVRANIVVDRCAMVEVDQALHALYTRRAMVLYESLALLKIVVWKRNVVTVTLCGCHRVATGRRPTLGVAVNNICT